MSPDRHWWPAALIGAVVSRRVQRAVIAAALLEGLADWRRVRAEQPLLPYIAAHRLDDLAYGAGLWAGAARVRTLAPLLPDLGQSPRPRSRQGSDTGTASDRDSPTS